MQAKKLEWVFALYDNYMVIRRFIILLLCFLFFYTGIAQKIELKGKVTERSTGAPLASASIQVLDASLHTISGVDGTYSLLFDK